MAKKIVFFVILLVIIIGGYFLAPYGYSGNQFWVNWACMSFFVFCGMALITGVICAIREIVNSFFD